MIGVAQDKLPFLGKARTGGIHRQEAKMISKILPVGRKIAGVRHPAATDITGCKRPPLIPPHLSRHLPCLLGDAGSFGMGGLKWRGIGGGCRLVRNGSFLGGADSRGFQGRLGAAHRCPHRIGTSERNSGGLSCPRGGGLNRRLRTGHGAWTKLGSLETYSR